MKKHVGKIQASFWDVKQASSLSTKIHHEVGKNNFSLRIQSPSQMVIGVYNHLLGKVFRFHETILSFGEPGSLGSCHR